MRHGLEPLNVVSGMGGINVNPKVTEEFLLAQDDVLDASVWISDGALSAHVTPAPGANLDPSKLIGACFDGVGSLHTPKQITLFYMR